MSRMKAFKYVFDSQTIDSSLVHQLLQKLEELAERLNIDLDAQTPEDTRVDVIVIQGGQPQQSEGRAQNEKITSGHQGSFLGVLPLGDRRHGSLDRSMFKADLEELKKPPENQLLKHKIERIVILKQTSKYRKRKRGDLRQLILRSERKGIPRIVLRITPSSCYLSAITG